MSNMRVGAIRFAIFLLASPLLCGCGFLPGFALAEDPAIYLYSVNEVANQVACELQAFISEQKEAHQNKKTTTGYKWVLDNGDVAVKLSLQTDHQGFVNFTGINVAKLGFESLATFVATTSATSSTPSLGAKLTAKRARTVEIDFSVAPKPLGQDKTNTNSKNKAETYNCRQWSLTNNPATHLYLRDWLQNYFDRLNSDHESKPEPNQLKIQSVELSTAVVLAVDIGGGATPYFLGNGATYIVPVNGLSLDYNPDYQNKVDINMKVCDNSRTEDSDNPCYVNDDAEKPTYVTDLLRKQCTIYSQLLPLLSGVKPPQDVDQEAPGKPVPGYHYICDKDGSYHKRKNSIGWIAS